MQYVPGLNSGGLKFKRNLYNLIMKENFVQFQFHVQCSLERTNLKIFNQFLSREGRHETTHQCAADSNHGDGNHNTDPALEKNVS